MDTMRELTIGAVKVSPPLALAPMAGVTDALFRRLFKRFGLGLTVSEFVSANSLVRMNRWSLEMIEVYDEERPTSVQLHGSDPDVWGDHVDTGQPCYCGVIARYPGVLRRDDDVGSPR